MEPTCGRECLGHDDHECGLRVQSVQGIFDRDRVHVRQEAQVQCIHTLGRWGEAESLTHELWAEIASTWTRELLGEEKERLRGLSWEAHAECCA